MFEEKVTQVTKNGPQNVPLQTQLQITLSQFLINEDAEYLNLSEGVVVMKG